MEPRKPFGFERELQAEVGAQETRLPESSEHVYLAPESLPEGPGHHLPPGSAASVPCAIGKTGTVVKRGQDVAQRPHRVTGRPACCPARAALGVTGAAEPVWPGSEAASVRRCREGLAWSPCVHCPHRRTDSFVVAAGTAGRGQVEERLKSVVTGGELAVGDHAVRDADDAVQSRTPKPVTVCQAVSPRHSPYE